MTPQTHFVLIFVVCAIGGALGARLAGSAVWKGAVATLAGIAAGELVGKLLPEAGHFATFAANLLILGVVGGALGMQGRQIGSVAFGAILFGFAYFALIESLVY